MCRLDVLRVRVNYPYNTVSDQCCPLCGIWVQNSVNLSLVDIYLATTQPSKTLNTELNLALRRYLPLFFHFHNHQLRTKVTAAHYLQHGSIVNLLEGSHNDGGGRTRVLLLHVQWTLFLDLHNTLFMGPASEHTRQMGSAVALQRRKACSSKGVTKTWRRNILANSSRQDFRGSKFLGEVDCVLEIIVLSESRTCSVLTPLVFPKRVVSGISLRFLRIWPIFGHVTPSNLRWDTCIVRLCGASGRIPSSCILGP